MLLPPPPPPLLLPLPLLMPMLMRTLPTSPPTQLIHWRAREARLLAPFYAFVLHADEVSDRYHKRLLRDLMHYPEEVYCKASQVRAGGGRSNQSAAYASAIEHPFAIPARVRRACVHTSWKVLFGVDEVDMVRQFRFVKKVAEILGACSLAGSRKHERRYCGWVLQPFFCCMLGTSSSSPSPPPVFYLLDDVCFWSVGFVANTVQPQLIVFHPPVSNALFCCRLCAHPRVPFFAVQIISLLRQEDPSGEFSTFHVRRCGAITPCRVPRLRFGGRFC